MHGGCSTSWGGVQQDLTLEVGAVYTLRYDFVGGAWDGVDTDIVRVQVGDNVWEDSDIDSTFNDNNRFFFNTGQTGVETAVHSWTAQSTTETLSFFNGGGSCADISNVVVTKTGTEAMKYIKVGPRQNQY